MTSSLLTLLKLSQAERDALFANCNEGPLPAGEARGVVLAQGASLCRRAVARIVYYLFWQGKNFSSDGTLRNSLSMFAIPGIRANVYYSDSWFDHKKSILLDYSKTSLVARPIRDEIRQVEPGLYLGKVWIGKIWVTDFALDFRPGPQSLLFRRMVASIIFIFLIVAALLAMRFSKNEPVTYADDLDHFKYGSTGGEIDAGLPLSIVQLLPELFPEYLPGKGLESLGFVYEPGHELPIGMSRRNVNGLERVFLNCAVCHAGVVRDSPASEPKVIVGMPSNTMHLQQFQNFLFRCAGDEKFNGTRIALEIEKRGTDDWINRQIIRYIAVDRMRERLLMIRERFRRLESDEPPYGPGRFDTFNPAKLLMNYPADKLTNREIVGVCDFPSIWNQDERKDMWLHWDGNNNSVEERNRSAAFGTGAIPVTLDRPALARTAAWLRSGKNRPPEVPATYQNKELAAKGAPIYLQYCASCHGRDGRDFTGEKVGRVTPIDAIGTDPDRLNSYTLDLCATQNLLYAGFPDERFQHFRKTFGYANQPLDGVWLRAPYLHNGSVPNLRELLEPAARRSVTFYRGDTVYDYKNGGFISNVSGRDGREFFLYDTRLRGNHNTGHEGKYYGTDLSAEEKDALVEFLKTF